MVSKKTKLWRKYCTNWWNFGKIGSEELSLDDSISEYEKAIKLIKDSEKLLEAGEGKVMKVLEKNGKVEMEEFE